MNRISFFFINCILVFLFSIAGFNLLSQNSIVLQPGPSEGKDVRVWTLEPTNNFANHKYTKLNAWTWGGEFGIERSFIEFDLHEIPPGVEIETALLSLYYHHLSGSPEQTHQGANSFLIQRTTSDWLENEVTWLNQPGLTTQNQVEVPPSEDPQQDYIEIDVTAMLIDAINTNSDSVFGMGFNLEVEETYRRVALSSSDHPNPNVWPKLEIFYSCFVDLGPDTTLCDGDTLILSTGPGFTNYLGNDESSDSTLMVTNPGTYWVNVWDNFDCFTGDTIFIEFAPNPDSTLNLGPDTILCYQDTLLLSVNGNFTSYQWQDGSQDSTFLVTQSGYYYVTVSNNCGTATDSISVIISDNISIDLGNDTLICGADSFYLAVNDLFAEYLWNTGSTDPSIENTESGLYWIEVTNEFGCSAMDTIEVILWPDLLGNFSLGEDTTLCFEESFQLSAGVGFDSYLWQDGTTGSIMNVTQAGVYFVIVSNICGETSDTIHINYYPEIEVSLGNDTTLCNGEIIHITPGNIYKNYLWQDGSVLNGLLVYMSGIYSVQATDYNNCVNEDEITISYLNVDASLGSDTSICENSEFTLATNSNYPGILWNDTIKDVEICCDYQGFYWVEVFDSVGQKFCYDYDTILIQFIETPSIEAILPEYSFCSNDSITISAPAGDAFNYCWSTGSSDNTITLVNPGIYDLTVHNECDTITGSFNVTTLPVPEPEIIADTLNDGELIQLSLTEFYDSYLWSDGSSASYIEVDYNGIFYVNVKNENNCYGLDSITINPFDCITFIPAAFTPNNDFSNELFFVDAANVIKLQIQIVNRWGEQVFESSDTSFKWDGTSNGHQCADGTYYYLIKYSCSNFSGELSQRIIKGNVMLLR